MKNALIVILATAICGLLFLNFNNQNKKIMKKNTVTWFSIPSDDLGKSTQFYNKVFGWKVEPVTEEANHDFDFHVVVNSDSDDKYISHQKGMINGCIVKRKIGLATPAILVEVENLDAAIAKVKAAGGTLVTEKIPMRSLDGVFVLVKDLDGNLVEIFQSLEN